MAHFCRTGQDPSGVGMCPERSLIYRDLIFSGVQGALRNNYPLTYALLQEEKWEELTHDFFAEYPCGDPQFWKMPKGLVEYVKESGWGEKRQIPFLADLVHFEWVEMEVYMMQDRISPPFSRQGDVLENVLILNPEHRLVTYDYPVFSQLSWDAPWKKGEYHLLCYRNPDTLGVHFFSLSSFFSHVIQALVDKEGSGRDALQIAAKRRHVAIGDQLFRAGRKLLEDLVIKRAILGFQPIRSCDEDIV